MIEPARRGGSSRKTLGILTAVSTVVALTLTGASAASAADRVSYSGSVPKWATSANDAGATAADVTFEGEIYLPLPNQAGAEALATAVSTPGSPLYRHPVSPKQWIQRFSPSKSTFDSVVSSITSQGFTISGVPASRLYVVFRGTAAQFGAAFQTTIHNYRVAGKTIVGPSSAPSVPASMAGMVSAISVDQGSLLTRPDLVSPDAEASVHPTVATKSLAKSNATPTAAYPCSTYIAQNFVPIPAAYGQTTAPTNICGYVPSQLRAGYGLDALAHKGFTGAGQTVAIIDAYASPTILADANAYATQVGDAPLAPGQFSQIVPTPAQFVDQAACAFPSGWQGEQNLDVESVHAIATGAHILYVGGFNCGGGLDLALSNIVDNKLANIVSNSYGDQGEALPENVLQGQENIHIEAAGVGVGLYFSSGDSGDEAANIGYTSPDFPASSPYVTAVGGTSIGIGKDGNIVGEVGWGDSRDQITTVNGVSQYATPLPGAYLYGAGGGTSAVFAQPAYQRGIVPSMLADNHRVVPDIAAIADPYTGFSIGITPIIDDTTLATGPFVRQTYGGTSLASPVTAAQIAIVQQVTHTTIGFANPTIYSTYRVLPSVFRDVVPQPFTRFLAATSASTGKNYLVTLDTDSSLKTARGYDNVTGLGGVTFGLLTQLAAGRH